MKANLKMLLALAMILTLAAFLGCSGGGSDGTITAQTADGPDITPGVPSSSSSANGFLWKPVSERDGKLVVLFPAAYRKRVTRGTVYAVLPPDQANVIEEGYFLNDKVIRFAKVVIGT